MLDLYTNAVWLFSAVFFGVIIFASYRRIRDYVRKERELNEVDNKYDAMLRQRENLMVASESYQASLLLVIGIWRKTKC